MVLVWSDVFLCSSHVFDLLLCFCTAFTHFYDLSACSFFYLCLVLLLLFRTCFDFRYFLLLSCLFLVLHAPYTGFPLSRDGVFTLVLSLVQSSLESGYLTRCLYCLLALCVTLHWLLCMRWFVCLVARLSALSMTCSLISLSLQHVYLAMAYISNC